MSAEKNDKASEAAKIVRNHVVGSLASGILPIPLVGVGILGGVQLRMLSKLAELYDVKFAEQRANAIIGALCGVGVSGTAGGLLYSLVGAAGGLFTIGGLAASAASTYALGQVFIKHFSSGGTFLNFDPEKAKGEYEEQLAEGKTIVVEKSYAGVKP